MSTEFSLTAQMRTNLGKGASRRLRRDAGLVPAVVYGAGKEAQSITLIHSELQKHMKHESFYTQVLTLDVAGKKESVVIKDIQRHPFKPLVLHMDLLRIKKGEKINMVIPFHFKGEDEAPGVKLEGGALTHLVNEAEISCLPSKLPEYIEVDVSKMVMDQVMHLSDLKLPAGMEFTALAHNNDLAIANIHKTRAKSEEAATDASAEEDGKDD